MEFRTNRSCKYLYKLCVIYFVCESNYAYKKSRGQKFEFISRIYQNLMCTKCKLKQLDFPEKKNGKI